MHLDLSAPQPAIHGLAELPRLETGPAETVVALLERQARLTPHARAVVCGDREITYAQLHDAANRLAVELQARGLAPRTRLVVAMDRSIELIIALLAVLKSGSTYVPLDLDYPPQRLQHVLDNAQPAAVLMRSGSQLHDTGARVPRVYVDTMLETSVASSFPLPPPAPEDAAYLIYTSGSTGVPKGVQVPHRAVANLLESMRREPGIEPHDTLLAVTTICFDIAVLEIFLPLACGACVVLATQADSRDGAALYRLLQRHEVTVLQATPLSWQLLLEAGWHGDPPLKMLCGGEAMPRVLAEQLLACGGELWNLYGPTETTVWSSALRVTSGTGPVLLGPPIANTCFHVLDAQLQPVVPGEEGELFIGGTGVALGYFAAPALTEQRFLPDPWNARARMYRTGDVVRQRGQCLEYLGRADDQVKLRGFRIELGEVEHALLRHPRVAQAAAAIRTAPSGEPVLCAYIVPRTGVLTESLRAELHANCAALLPHYMQPGSISALASLPRTPNGKLDRKALPLPAASTAQHAAAEQSPLCRTTCKRLAAIWRTVLAVEHVAPDANFFALGGHSLLAARLLRQVEAEFGVRLALAALLAAPTLQQQVQLLLQHDGPHYDFRREARLHSSGTKLPLIAIHNTGVYYYNLAQLLGAEQPLTALQLFDPASPRTSLPASIEEIANEYVQLICRIQPQGPYQLLGWCVGGVLAVEIARQLRLQQQAVSFLCLIDAWAPAFLRQLTSQRASLAQRSYRLQLVRADWQRVLQGRQRVRDFLGHRVMFKRLARHFGHVPAEPIPPSFENRHLSSEHYDRWLDGYLDAMAARYQPSLLDIPRALICSSRENRGWFLDPLMGWGRLLPAAQLVALQGDHFTVFQSQGLAQMAHAIESALASPTSSPAATVDGSTGVAAANPIGL